MNNDVSTRSPEMLLTSTVVMNKVPMTGLWPLACCDEGTGWGT